MKTITMTEFRREPGEVVRAVERHGASFFLVKGGRRKPVARLVPPTDVTVVLPDGTVQGPPILSAFVPGRVRAEKM